MSEPNEEQISTESQSEEQESKFERGVALVLCALVLLLPMIYIEHGYDAFTSEHGEAREGAAGAGLALAVVFRTVSRTVLRTIVRTSARAGVRASLKGAIKNAARTAIRQQTKNTAQKLAADQKKAAVSNLKSMVFASGLLYASWVIVIGFGQPFANLLNKEDSLAREAQELREHQELKERMEKPAIEAWEKKQILSDAETELETLRTELKQERDAAKQSELKTEIQLQKDKVIDANYEFSQAFEKSNGLLLNPNEDLHAETVEATAVIEWVDYLMTYAPFPGKTSWSSMVIWLGGLIMVLPLWVIFFVQSSLCRQKKVIMDHQTEWIGGGIQLYFAGAFSFMPLTSDVIIDTTPQNRSFIALGGLLAPTLIAMVLWYAWKQTGSPWILFCSDAFLLYPMVQVFPLDPLEGIHVWRWRKWQWLIAFFVIMGMFMLVSSEALKNVI